MSLRLRHPYKIAYHGFMVEFKDYENTQGLEELEGWRYFPIRAATGSSPSGRVTEFFLT